MNNLDVTWNKTGGNSGVLKFVSDIEGVATTYANLYRRVLLQSTPSMAIAAIRCLVDDKPCKNLFQAVPGLTDSLIDINNKLHNATFDVSYEDEGDEKNVKSFTVSIALNGKTMVSDLCGDKANLIADSEDDIKLSLVSKDETLTNVVGNHSIMLQMFFVKGSGYSQRDINKQTLEAVVGSSELDSWIVTDSQHRSVVNISYNVTNRLGKQIIELGVTSFQNNIEDVINHCTEIIVGQVSKITASSQEE